VKKALAAFELSRMRRLVLALASAFLALACQGPSVTAEVLPFHLAILPFDEVAGAGGYLPEESLHLERSAFARGLASLLDGLSFSAVTVLAPPDGVSAQEFASWSSERRQAHWLAAAEACQADLMLQAEVEPVRQFNYDMEANAGAYWDGLWKFVTYEVSEPVAWWLNGVFTLGRWPVHDRSYRFQTSFACTLHELGALLDPAGGADLANRRAELLRTFDIDSDAELEFVQRVGWFKQLLSFFVPAVLIPSTASVESRSLREAIAGQMAKSFVQELEYRKRELLRGNGLFPFEVERLALFGTPAQPQLVVEVVLHTEIVDALEGYRVWSDGALLADAEWPAPTPAGPDRQRYRLELHLPALRPASRVRLEVRDVAAKQNVRTFTLVLGRTGRTRERELAFELPDTE